MPRIGLLSDTHGYLDPRVFDYFAACDEVWHAGDFGTEAVADELDAFRPLRGVYGNVDGGALRQRFPLDAQFDCGGLRVWMRHIAGYPGRYRPEVRARLQEGPVPDLLVCGHSHILRVMPDRQYPPLLTLNPGAAGRHGFHTVRTLLRFTLGSGRISDMDVVELGPRAGLPS